MRQPASLLGTSQPASLLGTSQSASQPASQPMD